jgi:signal transduction histidine kinase
MGFDLDAVVREYGHLHRSIIDAAFGDGIAVTQFEHAILIESLYTGMGDAVTQYAEQRDAELRRQSNEHFAFVAHELRNPLASIQLAWNTILSKEQFPAKPLRDILSRGLKRVKDLIENTLTLAVVSEAVEIRSRPFDWRALVTEAIAESSIAAEGKDVRIETDGPEDWTLDGDERMMRSALTNLIGNAVKFTREGGRIVVRWGDKDDILWVDVSDQCGGLPQGAADKMFAPFVQFGGDRSGFGLGLAIANQAIRAHGGMIRVHNHPGDGCTLSIQLPRSIRSTR